MSFKAYQYGSSPENIVVLDERWADACNNLVLSNPKRNQKGRLIVEVNLSDEEMQMYDIAAQILNEYIRAKGGTIACTEEYLETHDILTPIE